PHALTYSGLPLRWPACQCDDVAGPAAPPAAGARLERTLEAFSLMLSLGAVLVSEIAGKFEPASDFHCELPHTRTGATHYHLSRLRALTRAKARSAAAGSDRHGVRFEMLQRRIREHLPELLELLLRGLFHPLGHWHCQGLGKFLLALFVIIY